MARKILNPVLPGGLLSPLSGVDELTDAEETMITNQQAGTGLNETPSGAVNGSNTTFTLSRSPSPAASLELYLNGQLQHSPEDFTLSTNTITMGDAPLTGDTLRAFSLIDTDT